MTAQPRPLPRLVHLAAIGVCVAVAAVIGALWLLHGHKRLAGTDSVEPATPVATLKPAQRLCVRDLVVPGNANAIRFQLSPASPTGPNVSLALHTVAGANLSSGLAVTGTSYADFPISRTGKTSGATACLRTSQPLTVWGYPGVPATTRPQAFLQRKPLTARVSVWFWDSRNRSLASLLPTAARRASVFRAGFVGPWIYLVIALVIPLMWLLGLRTLLRGDR